MAVEMGLYECVRDVSPADPAQLVRAAGSTAPGNDPPTRKPAGSVAASSSPALLNFQLVAAAAVAAQLDRRVVGPGGAGGLAPVAAGCGRTVRTVGLVALVEVFLFRKTQDGR